MIQSVVCARGDHPECFGPVYGCDCTCHHTPVVIVGPWNDTLTLGIGECEQCGQDVRRTTDGRWAHS